MWSGFTKKYAYSALVMNVLITIAACGRGGLDLSPNKLGFSGTADRFNRANFPLGPRSAENSPESRADTHAAQNPPPQYLLQSPVKAPYLISYFYGTRISRSFLISLDLISGKKSIPQTLAGKNQTPKKYLSDHFGPHSGVDFAVHAGTPVYAPADGVVLGQGFAGCTGYVMIIKHTLADGRIVYSNFHHLTGPKKGKLVVATGSSVKAGQQIAVSGSSGTPISSYDGGANGCVEGPNLHFEVHVKIQDGKTRDWESLPEKERLEKFYAYTARVNPADFVAELDQLCQERKNTEIKNAFAVEKYRPGSVPMLSAGRCGQAYEAALTSLPAIYSLQDKKDLKNFVLR